MATKRMLRWIVGFLVLCSLLSLLGACRPLGERSERASTDWSRGERIGRTSANDAVALVLEPSGERAYLAWVTRRDFDGVELLHVAVLDRAGRVIQQRDLDIEVSRPSSPRLARTDRALHLFWIDRPGATRQLFHAMLDTQGWGISDPTIISPADLTVDSYAVNARPDGGLDVALGAVEGEKTGLFYLALDASGTTSHPVTSFGIPGFDPALYRDSAGALHLVWEQAPDYGERNVFYGVLEPTTLALQQVTKLGVYPVGVGLVGHPPAIGLAGGDVYAFWSIERRGGGMTPPMADSFYVQFPVGRPELAGPPRPISVPSWNNPAYTPAQSDFRIAKKVVSSQGDAPSAFVYFPSVAASQGNELAVAFSVQLTGRTKEIIQIAMSYWRGGELVGYQIVGQTSSTSLKPVVAADGQADLHLAWIDTAGFGAYDLFYASTAPAVQERLNRITPQDLLMRLLNVLWGMVQALGFVPVILAWGFVPLVVIVIYVLFVPEAEVSRVGSQLVLGISILFYIAFKYSFRPGWLMDLPLPASLPPHTADALILVTPLLISFLSGVAIWQYGRKRPSASIFPAFGLFVLIDALVTLMIYVPGVLGE